MYTLHDQVTGHILACIALHKPGICLTEKIDYKHSCWLDGCIVESNLKAKHSAKYSNSKNTIIYEPISIPSKYNILQWIFIRRKVKADASLYWNGALSRLLLNSCTIALYCYCIEELLVSAIVSISAIQWDLWLWYASSASLGPIEFEIILYEFWCKLLLFAYSLIFNIYIIETYNIFQLPCDFCYLSATPCYVIYQNIKFLKPK